MLHTSFYSPTVKRLALTEKPVLCQNISSLSEDSSEFEQLKFWFIFVQICIQRLLVKIQCVKKVSSGAGAAVMSAEVSLSSIQFFKSILGVKESDSQRLSPHHSGQMTKIVFLCPDAPAHLCLYRRR